MLRICAITVAASQFAACGETATLNASNDRQGFSYEISKRFTTLSTKDGEDAFNYDGKTIRMRDAQIGVCLNNAADIDEIASAIGGVVIDQENIPDAPLRDRKTGLPVPASQIKTKALPNFLCNRSVGWRKTRSHAA